MLLPVLTVVVAMVTVCSAVTDGEINELRSRVNDVMITPNRGNIARLVRLSFHDAVGVRGADGCVDFGIGENNGLQQIFAQLQALYQAGPRNGVNPTVVSFADFVALAGVEASVQGYSGRYNGQSSFQFMVGRQTSANCAGVNAGQFPSALAGYQPTMQFLRTQFNLADDAEAIALLGAHSLGGAELGNSGFQGPWTGQPDSLDNGYYNVLLNSEGQQWSQRDPGQGLLQWQRPPPGRRSQAKREFLENLLSLMTKSRRKRQGPPLMMLNADMCLIKDFQVTNAATGATNCGGNVATCPDSPGKQIVQQLSGQNNDAFIDRYIVAFTKMINKVGNQGVTLALPNGNTAPAPTPAPSGGGGGGKRPKKRATAERRALEEIIGSLLEAVEENEAK